MKVFLVGGSGGIGQATRRVLESQGHQVEAPSRENFDITDFQKIHDTDLSLYDVVINCAGANQGAYRGWHHNDWRWQEQHVAVNFTGPLFLAKQYTLQRQTGQFVYVTSASVDDPRSYTIFMVGSKGALRLSLNAVKKDYPGIVFTEIVPGKCRTNMLKQNYQGTKSDSDIAKEYDSVPVLDPVQVAEMICTAMTHKLDRVDIVPR